VRSPLFAAVALTLAGYGCSNEEAPSPVETGSSAERDRTALEAAESALRVPAGPAAEIDEWPRHELAVAPLEKQAEEMPAAERAARKLARRNAEDAALAKLTRSEEQRNKARGAGDDERLAEVDD